MAVAARSANGPSDVRPDAAREAPGLLGKLLRLVAWALVSLLISILIEWVGMSLWWPEEGVAHSRMMLETEIGYLSGDLRQTALVTDTAAFGRAFADAAYEGLWVRTGLMRGLGWLAEPPPGDASGFRRLLHGLYAAVADHVLAAAHITQVFALRLAVLTLSLPVFGLASLVGTLDGLVQRDLRRWGGGRESSFLYHHARRLIWPVFLLAWVLYLSLPTSLHPSLAILPFAAVVGVLMAVTAASFKKYL
jgi:integrating conjugative element membrane protein (TIGR03747 family)